MRRKRSRTHVAAAALAALLIGAPGLVGSALALAPSGACCLPGGTCQDLLDFTCEQQGGTFVGAGVPCAEADCDASLTAPALSLLGLASAIAALAGLGLYRLLFRRR